MLPEPAYSAWPPSVLPSPVVPAPKLPPHECLLFTLQVFTSITPAWNNDNLNRLATKLESGVIFAHVRAAYPGMPVSEANCHPFQWGRYIFMVRSGLLLRVEGELEWLGVMNLMESAVDCLTELLTQSSALFCLFAQLK
jgi:predicted glutamine amidotransferase